jgi:hypothetical protein
VGVKDNEPVWVSEQRTEIEVESVGDPVGDKVGYSDFVKDLVQV